MTLYEIYELMNFIGNKDYEGNVITPERFKILIKAVNIEYFREKYGLPEQYQPGRPVPLEYAEATLKSIDDLRAFKERLAAREVTDGLMLVPDDYAHYDTIIYNYVKNINGVDTTLPRPVEILRESEAVERRGNYTKRPTLQNPIGVIRNDGIFIEPITITEVDFTYYRWPNDPVFVYNQYDGYITYDAGSSTELEWTKDEHLQIVALMMSYMGVHLRVQDIFNYAEMKKKEGI